jgi:hypothetical protein
MREQVPFGVVALKSGSEARFRGGGRYSTSARSPRLIEVDSAEANILWCAAAALQRYGSGGRTDSGWRRGALADDPVVAPSASHANVVKSLLDAVATLSAQGAEPFLAPHRFESAGWVANRWCEILPLPVDAKHRLLGLDPLARLDIIDSLMRVRQAPH